MYALRSGLRRFYLRYRVFEIGRVSLNGSDRSDKMAGSRVNDTHHIFLQISVYARAELEYDEFLSQEKRNTEKLFK